MNNANSRLQINCPSNNIWVGAIVGDGAGDYHVWDNSGVGRIFGWYRSSNEIRLGYTNGNTKVLIQSTTDSTSSTTGGLQISGGVGIVKNFFVGGNVTAATPTAAGHLATKSYVDSYTGAGGSFTVKVRSCWGRR